MILYLFPFPLLKYFVCRYVSTPKPLTGDAVISLTGKIIQTSNGFYLNSTGCLQKIFIGLWICSLCVVIFYEIFTFIRFHRKISQNVLSDPGVIKIVEIIRHELQHIKSYDFLFRQLAFLALILHCYNPFIYIFFREIKEVQELACDENVMKYFSKDEQKWYGYLLIMTAAKEGSEMKSKITLMFSKNNRSFLIKRIKRIGVYVKPIFILNVVTIIFMLTTSCIPVFAYNPPTADLRSVPWTGFFNPAEGARVSVSDNGNEIDYITYFNESSIVSSDEEYFKHTDSYFITDNGKIIMIEPKDIQTRSSCSHTFVNGTLKKHIRNSKGGCSVKTYKGKICTKCNYTKNLALESTITYTHCPH